MLSSKPFPESARPEDEEFEMRRGTHDLRLQLVHPHTIRLENRNFTS